MTYVVLARKWRPQRFEDVLGQEHVTRTLKNAIEADRIAHAFLFSGPRGVGKTSAARILAKALCCTSASGPTPEPCGTCPTCIEITEGRSTDIFEIDAASHTGVDNVREIIDNVRFLPASARFKIYVIDEVHMLSQGAFNALLKTLEEPPDHVKFVLATTDVHKVPVTILSRVQRFDFRRIPGPRIVERLSRILKEEGVDHDPSALTVIAREAEGSMRDAQSLLEQVRAFVGDAPLDGDRVREALGVVDGRVIRATLDALLERRPDEVFREVAQVYERGLDLVRFSEALLTEVRDLLVARLVKDPAATLDRPKDEIETLVQVAWRHDAPTFERLFQALSDLVETVANSTHPRFALEVGLASMAEAPPRVDLETLVDRLDDVLAGGGPPGPSSPGASGRGGPSGSRPRSSRRQAGPATEARGDRAEAPSPPARSKNAPSDAGSASGARAGVRASDHRGAQKATEAPRLGGAGSDAPPSQGAGSDAPPSQVAGSDAPPSQGAGSDVPPSQGAGSDVPPSRGVGGGAPSTGEAGDGVETAASGATDGEGGYRAFVQAVKAERPALAATLMQVRPLTFAADGVELRCETAFDADSLGKASNKDFLQERLNAFFGETTALSITRGRKAQDAPAPTLNEEDDAAREARRRDKAKRAVSHPAVQAVAGELGGSIGKVHVVDD